MPVCLRSKVSDGSLVLAAAEALATSASSPDPRVPERVKRTTIPRSSIVFVVLENRGREKREETAALDRTARI